MSSQDCWHIPYHDDGLSLRLALASVPLPGPADRLPLMLRLQRDPDLSFLGQLVFRAGLDRHQHDCIHILLGRGLLPMDQAFVMGFTLASSWKGSIPEHRLNAEVGRHFFKRTCLFDETEGNIFKDGIRLGYLSFCAPLDSFDFNPWHDRRLSELRDAIGLDREVLLAYYAVERHRHPHAAASQRLLPSPDQAAVI